ncbi:radical SAM family heme chaperone HemW [bacterium]|nr:radical SAM family heme chaperone HemW [bacterium]
MTNLPDISSCPGLYIHIPFCRTKCVYCDFVSSPEFDSDIIARYIRAIGYETGKKASSWKEFDTIYIGGGTPSLLEARDISKIFSLLHQRFEIMKNCEITLEANPGDITNEKISVWKNLGITRISLGVQSLNDEVLTFLKRRHSARQAISAFDQLTEAGFSVAMDLIFGYPEHTVDAWKSTLLQVIKLKPNHLSCYQLTIESGTPLAAMVQHKKTHPICQDVEADLFKTSQKTLQDHGYDHYEISNFAADSSHYSRHNTKYWFRVPYLGIGVAAHSFNGNTRWSNYKNVDEYCKQQESSGNSVDFSEEISEQNALVEQIFLGLRTRWGIARNLLPDTARRSVEYKNFVDSGWLLESEDRIWLTPAGFCVADYLARELIAMSLSF